MDWIHQCSFCGFGRGGSSPAMLEPHCPDCGSGLTALRRGEVEAAEQLDIERLQRALPQLPPALASAARTALGILLMLAAARAGYVAGGTAIAVTAFGATGLLSVPLLAANQSR